MDTPILTWTLIIAAVAVVFIIDAIYKDKSSRKQGHRHSSPIVESGSEREMFFAPGDPRPGDLNDYDYEFEDL